MTHTKLLGTSRLATLLGAAIIAASSGARAQSAVPSSPTRLPPLKVVDVTYMDRKANACTDFDQFANGGWLAHDTIPAAYSSSGVARDMGDRNELVVRSVLEDAMKHASSLPATSTEHKLGVFYGTCMDSTAAERAGMKPITPLLDRIAATNSRGEVLARFAELQKVGATAAFNFGPSNDPHEAGRYTETFSQGGLGLPDRDYYTNTGTEADSIRSQYQSHIVRLLTLAGATPASAASDARRIIALETDLAKASLTQVVLRDPAATDHPMTLAAFQKITPHIEWPAFLHSMDVSVPVTRGVVAEPAFFARLDTLIETTPLETWRAYLRYQALEHASPWLSTPFVNEHFTFVKTFSGAKELLPRWKRCLRETDGSIGEALGEAYVGRTFSPAARARAKAVIDDIRAAFGQRIRALDWMSDTTKARALDKLARVREKVGYPEHWRDYTKLDVANRPFVLNDDAATAFEWNRIANRPGSPVDTLEWGMTVPTVNAYYNPLNNEMVFPAGALSPQTFDANADDGANYGSLGASWAGHELTHGFDDQGRHFDAQGNLRDWWLPADSVHFSQQATLVADQYNGYIQVDTLHVNGRLTLGENIADYGGTLTGYDALQRALVRDGRPGLIEGLTPEQRFFIAYAQSFRGHSRPESLRSRQMTDPHSPDKWRVNGPLSNMHAFAQAFGCKPGDAMVRPDAVVGRIW